MLSDIAQCLGEVGKIKSSPVENHCVRVDRNTY
jgi:hypothetical protein